MQLLQRGAEARSEAIDTYTQVPRRVFIDVLKDLNAVSSMDAQNDADVARSERNIPKWMAHLPEDCVKTMIKMGWDVTT